MAQSVFLQLEFYLLILFSLIFPAAIFGTMLLKKAISRTMVFLFGVSLLLMAGADIILLRKLALMASNALSGSEDKFFNSEMAVSLYLLPAFLAGVGVNIISHILIRRLREAEDQFERDAKR
ncbi:nitrogen fixation/metabolism regulation signal transduction histidine kinase [Herbaspirillum sp. Sphag1AN]|uniref:hypothetical protein n=1 Tax=unclassified Herbaspirillum TaxID=2624150 RepID=UPI00161EE9F7|nr:MULTISPECIES: hypothetical protein [unclassified Herbaspirillum]MBB3214291.1 nitrogen fixation/metabolism regulation signal transduction histidine kinase [Herbaspirillum sp. Sphag1AN]MBB3247343.1 nitrogen fixation/metabolism regulation signal transduction histidine kinase [Herbaspirillum sp. Sphag64]